MLPVHTLSSGARLRDRPKMQNPVLTHNTLEMNLVWSMEVQDYQGLSCRSVFFLSALTEQLLSNTTEHTLQSFQTP